MQNQLSVLSIANQATEKAPVLDLMEMFQIFSDSDTTEIPLKCQSQDFKFDFFFTKLAIRSYTFGTFNEIQFNRS